MFDKLMATFVATAAACAAAVLAVFALGFSIYALLVPAVGAAAAAAIVALIAALGVAIFALIVTLRARRRDREAAAIAAAQPDVLNELPLALADIARDRPLLTLGISAVGGLLATRHPTLVRDLVHIVARFTNR